MVSVLCADKLTLMSLILLRRRVELEQQSAMLLERNKTLEMVSSDATR